MIAREFRIAARRIVGPDRVSFRVWVILDEAGDQMGSPYSTADDAETAIGFAALVASDVLQEVAPAGAIARFAVKALPSEPS